MYTADATTIAYLANPTREYDLRIGIVDGTTTYIPQSDGTIFTLKGDGNIQHSDYFTLGAITANALTLSLSNTVTVPTNGEVIVEIRLNGSSGYGDWIPMGHYFVDDRTPEVGSYRTSYTLYDSALYADASYVATISFPATIQAIWNDATTQAGFTTSAVLDSVTIDEEPVGYTCRNILGYMAALCGGHFVVNRDGNYDLVKPYENTSVDLTIPTNMYSLFKRIDDSVKTVSRVTCQFSTSSGDSVTLGDDTGYELYFDCPFITTTAELQDVFDMYDGFTFVPYSALQWIGDPRIDLGDHLSLVDYDDGVTTYDCYVMDNEWSYGGGLSMFTTSKVKSESASEFPTPLDIYKAIQDRSTFYDLYTEGRVQIHGGNIIAGTLVAESIAAEQGYISELTVDQLSTETKVQNYLASDTSDVNYIKIYEQYLEFITAETDGLTFEQASNRKGELLYWTDATESVSSTTVTAYPVYVYIYTELEKTQIAFETVDGVETPVITLGAGSGGEGTTNGKGYLYKGIDGLELRYFNQLDNIGIHQQHSEDDVNHIVNGNVAKNVFPVDNATNMPDGVADGSIAVVLKDYSLEDFQAFTASGTVDVSAGRNVDCDGTFTLTLYSLATELANGPNPTISEMYLLIRNNGTGTITLAADGSETINVTSLTAGQWAHCWGQGTAWNVKVV